MDKAEFIVSDDSVADGAFLGIESRLIVCCKCADRGLPLRSAIVCSGFCVLVNEASSTPSPANVVLIFFLK